ncbi:MAG: hypothetical protein L0Z62_00915 [Gemmataceae bacterium]|nr:hypothetical protein [Gemmataceae bacterium]
MAVRPCGEGGGRLSKSRWAALACVCALLAAGCDEKNPETFHLRSGSGVVRHVTFKAGVRVQMWVRSQTNSDVDLFVYDAEGDEVAVDEGDSKDCYVSFVPAATQRFRIEVQNRVRLEPYLRGRNIANRCTLKWEPKATKGK